jgi:hypothetical protein
VPLPIDNLSTVISAIWSGGSQVIIYISGPMTGYPDLNFPAFHYAAAELRGKGFEVISPAEIELPQYPKGYVPKDEADRKAMWRAFMKADIAEMMKTDTVAVLPGWEKSEGATIEVDLALVLGMDIVDAYTMEEIE